MRANFARGYLVSLHFASVSSHFYVRVTLYSPSTLRDHGSIAGRAIVKIGTFRSEDEDDCEYEFSVLNMRIRFGGRHFSKCACSGVKTRTRSRPRPSI